MEKLESENQHCEENQKSFKCSACNRTFSKPILATLSSCRQVQTYYACPHCLTKIAKTKNPKGKRGKGDLSTVEKVGKAASMLESDVECKHFLGYLKKRPKDTSIPDECLLCEKMIECLTN